jgi:LSD1 subclass zinc finger protein
LSEEIRDLKKNREASVSSLRTSDDFHNFLEYTRLMGDIKQKEREIEEKKENRDALREIVGGGIGAFSEAIAAVMTARSGQPQGLPPGSSGAPAAVEAQGIVGEHTVQLPCMYCHKPIVFPKGVKRVKCPHCSNIMDVDIPSTGDGDEPSGQVPKMGANSFSANIAQINGAGEDEDAPDDGTDEVDDSELPEEDVAKE